MLRRIPRFLRFSVLVVVALAVSISVFQSWASGTPGTGGWVQTQWGPLGPADRDLLVKVRLAGLWEGPTGQQAMQQASSADVKEIGRIISTEHAALDAEVRNAADQLGVLLPTSPSPQQLAWMSEISAATGPDYDRLFIQRLREAHGIVLPLIAEVRASTRNELVRTFAATADRFVTGHIQHLEGSGMVNYAELPESPGPGLLSGERTPTDLIVPILVFMAAILAALCLVTALRKKSTGRPQRLAPPVSPGPASTAVAMLPAPRAPRSESTGSHRIPTGARTTPPGETTGPRHVYAKAGAAPGETTGPRHSIRR
ncbi:DUF4142 domain-containing protein [Actinomycetes bacterium KLBMP 9759]